MEYQYNSLSFTNKSKTFESEVNKYNGYKQIRLDLLNHLNINDQEIKNLLNGEYLRIFLNLTIQYKKELHYFEYYREYKEIKNPELLYRYYYSKFKKRTILAIFLRIRYAFSLRLKK